MTVTTGLLDSDFVARVKALTFEQKEQLSDLIWEDELPPPKNIDWPAEIERRAEHVTTGQVQTLTREQSDTLLRAEMRKFGIEL